MLSCIYFFTGRDTLYNSNWYDFSAFEFLNDRDKPLKQRFSKWGAQRPVKGGVGHTSMIKDRIYPLPAFTPCSISYKLKV